MKIEILGRSRVRRRRDRSHSQVDVLARDEKRKALRRAHENPVPLRASETAAAAAPASASVTTPAAASVRLRRRLRFSRPRSARADDIEDVHVYAPSPLPNVGVSDVHFRVGELWRARGAPTDNASKLSQSATPILLTNEGGEGHAEQVFLRGFDAREGQDIEFSVGGVPINESGNLHGNGYADTHFIIPELVSRCASSKVRSIHAKATTPSRGARTIELGLAQRGLPAKYTGGSWNTQRGLLLWGPEGERAHVRRRRDLFDARLRTESRRRARKRDGSVRRQARRQGRLSSHRAALRDALSLRGIAPRRRLQSRQSRLLRQLRSQLVRARGRSARRRLVALLDRGRHRDARRRHDARAARLHHQTRHAPAREFHRVPARCAGAVAITPRATRRRARHELERA